MKNNPVNRWGWTLQESLLSPRILSYGSQQMVWECQQRRVDECGRPISPGENHLDKRYMQSILTQQPSILNRILHQSLALYVKSFPPESPLVPSSLETRFYQLYCRWYNITKDFTERSLTVQTDVLPALSGLARVFQKALNDQYCAGLWRNDIITGLMWNRMRPSHKVSHSHQRHHDLPNYRIPSWSWASINGGMLFNISAEETDRQGTFVEETARVLEINTTPRFANPFGQTRDGNLVMRAPFCFIKNLFVEEQNSSSVAHPVLEAFIQQQLEVEDNQWEFKQQHKAHLGQRFALLRIAKTYRINTSQFHKDIIRRDGAKLMIVETTGQQEDEYRRVGMVSPLVPYPAEPDDDNVQVFQEMKRAKWEWKKVRLV